jgi:DegV family protein with EDD domain
MRDYIILSDSGTDLTPAIANELDIRIIDLTVIMDGEDPKPDSAVDHKEFYAFLRNKKMARTSAVNPETFSEIMEQYIKDGKDVLYIGFSSGLSNTYNAGRIAAEELREKYPDAKILTSDSLCASLGQGMLVYLAAKKRLAGASIDEVHAWVEATKLHLCHQFTVDDLMFLKRGGRVSAATAAVGTMLGIKPVMHVDNDGHLTKVGTARGRRASIDALFDKTAATVTEKDIMFICHGDCIDDANYLAERVRNELGVKEVIIGYTGVVIGSHSGPGTLSIFHNGTES